MFEQIYLGNIQSYKLVLLPAKQRTKGKTMARKTVRVDVPREDRPALIKLALAIIKQHGKAGAASPITDKLLDMVDYTDRANQAASLQSDIEDLERTLQTKVGLRDQLLGLADGQNAQTKDTTLFETLQIRDLLLAVNRGNEEGLEPWGFDVVVGSASAPKKKDKTKPA